MVWSRQFYARVSFVLFTATLVFLPTSARAGCVDEFTNKIYAKGVDLVAAFYVSLERDPKKRAQLEEMRRFFRILAEAGVINQFRQDPIGAMNKKMSPLAWLRLRTKADPAFASVLDEVERLAGSKRILWIDDASEFPLSPTIDVSMSDTFEAHDSVSAALWSLLRALSRTSKNPTVDSEMTLAEYRRGYVEGLINDEINSVLAADLIWRRFKGEGLPLSDQARDPQSQLILAVGSTPARPHAVREKLAMRAERLHGEIERKFRGDYQKFDLEALGRAFALPHRDETLNELRRAVAHSGAISTLSGSARSQYVDKLIRAANLDADQIRLLKRAAKVP